jgi:hypothetical protein
VATPNEIRRIEIAASRVAAQLLGGLLGLPAAWFLFSTPGVPSFEAQVNPAKGHNAGVEGFESLPFHQHPEDYSDGMDAPPY